MKQYKNITPQTLTFTLADGSEHIIASEGTANLPADNGYISSLVAQGKLAEVSPKPKTAEK
jgi:hypothetical protein